MTIHGEKALLLPTRASEGRKGPYTFRELPGKESAEEEPQGFCSAKNLTKRATFYYTAKYTKSSTFLHMEPQIIGVKQLYKELKQISQAVQWGKTFLVVKNSKPVFRIEPVKKVARKEYSLRDFKKLQFTTSDKALSKRIDSIVYPA